MGVYFIVFGVVMVMMVCLSVFQNVGQFVWPPTLPFSIFSFAFVQPALLQALFHPLPSLNFFLLYNFLPLSSLAFINSPHAAHIMQNPNQTIMLSGGLTYAPAACPYSIKHANAQEELMRYMICQATSFTHVSSFMRTTKSS